MATKYITVIDELDLTEFNDWTLGELIEMLTEALETIPVDERDLAKVHIWAGEDRYECGYAHFSVRYQRPETPEETAEREREEERKRIAERHAYLEAQKIREEHEQRLYERLKAKYG